MKKKILIVDDNQFIRTMIEEYFKNEFEIYSAENGIDAIKTLQIQVIPDLIITDINMPEMDGSSLFYHLKTSLVYQNIPLIVLSATDESAERINYLSLGACDFLAKPFNPEELLVRSRNIIKLAS